MSEFGPGWSDQYFIVWNVDALVGLGLAPVFLTAIGSLASLTILPPPLALALLSPFA